MFKKTRKSVVSVLCAMLLVFVLGCGVSFADEYPNGPLKVIFGAGPGGGIDVSFRLIQPFLEAELGQPIEIVYREGAGSQIASTAVANAAPDGYTFGVYTSPMVEFSILMQGATFNLDSFAFLGAYTFEPQVMLIRKDETRWKNVQDLLAYAKEHPGEVSFSITGIYNDAFLGLKLIEEKAGVKFNLIPFESGSAGRMALVGGHVDASQSQIFSAQNVWANSRMIAMMWETNDYTQYTDAPPFNEATGLDLPNLGQGTGFFMPAGVKERYPERFERLRAAIEKAVNNPEYVKVLKEADQYGKLRYTGAEETTAFMKSNMEMLEKYTYLYDDVE